MTTLSGDKHGLSYVKVSHKYNIVIDHTPHLVTHLYVNFFIYIVWVRPHCY